MGITTLADVVRVHGRDRPDAPAVIVGDHTITFGELDQRSNRVAQALAAAGVGFGDRVAFVERNGAEFFDVVFGLAKLGAVAVPVNWRLAAPEMRQIIDDAGAALVIVGADFVGHLEAVEDGLAAGVVAIGGHDRWPSFDSWVAGHPARDPGVVTGPDDLVFLMYTSGTTGAPKGVMLSNANYRCKCAGVAGPWRMDAEAVTLAVMPLFHMAGSGWALAGLWHGGAVVVLRDVDPAAILDSVARHGVTNLLLVPAVIARLLERDDPALPDFADLRIVVYGASPISDDVLLRGIDRFGSVFAQVYGMTETTGSVTQLDGADHVAHLLRSCGKPYPWVQIRIVGPDGTDVAPGAVGEVWTRSAQNMLGYWNNPQATEKKFAGDWLLTGDTGMRDHEGWIRFVGRDDDVITSSGYRIGPGEIEDCLLKHPAVALAGVVGKPDTQRTEIVKAFIVLKDGITGSDELAKEIADFVKTRLAAHEYPREISFVDALPMTTTGKVIRRIFRERARSE